MGKILKKKKKLKKKGNSEEGPSLKKKRALKKKLKKKKVLKKKRIRKPQGRWCIMKDGALPFPIECHALSRIRRHCNECTRKIEYGLWRVGAYVRIEDDIDKGIDFTDPENVPVYVDVKVSSWSASTTPQPTAKAKKKKKLKKKT